MGQPVGHDCGIIGDGINWGIMGSGQNASSFGVGVTGLGGNTGTITYMTGCGGAFRGTAGISSYGEAGAGALIQVADGSMYWALQLGDGTPGNMQEGYADGWWTYKDGEQGPIALPAPSAINHDIYASGTAQVINGNVSVEFPYPFNELVSSEVPVVVTVTPLGECNGLYIAESRADGFTVKELNGGRSNASFNWIAVGREKGRENIDYRMKEFSEAEHIKASVTTLDETATKERGATIRTDDMSTDKLRKDKGPETERIEKEESGKGTKLNKGSASGSRNQ
jgi:hypothetical protein